MERNPKKLYNNNIIDFTGISQTFDTPLNHHVEVKTNTMSIKECVDNIMLFIYLTS